MNFLITLGNGASIVKNDTITFIPNTLRGYSCNVTISTFVPTRLVDPLKIAAPTANLSSPTGAVSLCSSVSITMTQILNDGKRPLSKI